MKKRVVFIVFIALFAGVSLLVYYGQWKSKRGETYYSGTVEATHANLGFQVGGRIISVLVKEGEAVQKDQVLAELDKAEIESKYDQAKANLERATKAKEQTETLLEIYKSTLPDDVRRAEANVAMTRSVMADAQKNHGKYETLFKRGVVTEKERDTVKLGYDNSLSRVRETEAVLDQAKSGLRKIDVTMKDIEVATAQIALAKAALDQAGIYLKYTQLRSPFNGTVTSRNIEPGEVVNPGREVLTIADLSRIDLKIFVDETEIGTVKPGQNVDVKVDTFPDKVFPGNVAYISPEAEFTPKIIQTKKERVKLVYMVKVSVPNPDTELKSGMPADAYLR